MHYETQLLAMSVSYKAVYLKSHVLEEVGFESESSMTFETVRKWMIDTAALALKSDSSSLALVSSLATLYKKQGKYDKAEPLLPYGVPCDSHTDS